jgi:enamine deaminase RidA (YjgF/YER057c/UK114 family)
MPDLRRQELRVPGLDEPISHYTAAVRFGNMVFASGMGPLAEDEVRALAVPGMKVEIEAVVGLPA